MKPPGDHRRSPRPTIEDFESITRDTMSNQTHSVQGFTPSQAVQAVVGFVLVATKSFGDHPTTLFTMSSIEVAIEVTKTKHYYPDPHSLLEGRDVALFSV